VSGRRETLEEKIARVLRDEVSLTGYDPRWPRLFEVERDHLRACLPADLLGRIEHFGSTAVPNLAAKPVVDLLIEVRDLREARRRIVPVLEEQGYDYFWRSARDDGSDPHYCWLIKRDGAGRRTHHLHMVEPHFEHWDRLLFRDWLITHPETAAEYAALKRRLAEEHPGDRIAYTRGKTAFVLEVTDRARREGERDRQLE
jgi:GrpB-like predicted nucleotidyltransferase (UPF0157 family)